MIFGAWNVHTLIDSANTLRPERTALIARELTCYNIDIAALNEMRLQEKDKFVNQKEDTHFSGKEKERMRTEFMGRTCHQNYISVPGSRSPNVHQWMAD